MRIGGTSRYSDVVIYERIAYLSGIVPTKDGSVYEQAKEVFSILDKNLKCVGTSNENILSMTIYLTDINTYDEMNIAYDEWIPNKAAPARATIGATLPNSMWKIEVVATVSIPTTQSKEVITNLTSYHLNYIV